MKVAISLSCAPHVQDFLPFGGVLGQLSLSQTKRSNSYAMILADIVVFVKWLEMAG